MGAYRAGRMAASLPLVNRKLREATMKVKATLYGIATTVVVSTPFILPAIAAAGNRHP